MPGNPKCTSNMMKLFPNRGLRLHRVLIMYPRGDTQKHTHTHTHNVAGQDGLVARRSHSLSRFRSDFCDLAIMFRFGKKCNSKTKGLVLGNENEEQNRFVLHCRFAAFCYSFSL